MKKINDSHSLDNNAVSIDALKSVEKGDMVLFMGDNAELALFTVLDKVTTRGRKGGTALKLQGFVDDAIMELASTNTLPEGVMMVRKVLKGVNSRTLRRVVPEDLSPVSEGAAVEAAPEEAPEAIAQ